MECQQSGIFRWVALASAQVRYGVRVDSVKSSHSSWETKGKWGQLWGQQCSLLNKIPFIYNVLTYVFGSTYHHQKDIS